MFRRNQPAVASIACMVALATSIAQAANDPDSFGRAVKYLDVGQAPAIIYYSGTLQCPAGATCKQVTNPQTLQTFNEPDRLVISLPAAATNSLLCFSYSPFINYVFSNTATSAVTARLTHQVNVVIDSAVLANPFLINKVTGQPFNGSLVAQGIGAQVVLKTLPPNSSEQQANQTSRECINGFINTQALQSTYGLTLSQAQSVMRSAMTVRFSTVTTMQNTTFLTTQFGVRLFGD